MQQCLVVDDELMACLYEHRILLKRNSPAPTVRGYGWLQAGDELKLHATVTIEENCGLYGGKYKPLVGGIRSSGLCPMGAFSYSYSPLPEAFSAGRYCSISTGLKFLDSAHPLTTLTTSAILFRPNNHLFRDQVSDRVRDFAQDFDILGGKHYPQIEHDVWIGANVTLGLGIRIGTGAVIATNSTVTKDVPPYAIVAGNPAQIKGYRFAADTIDMLLASHWWEYEPRQLLEADFTRPEAVCEQIAAGRLSRYEPRSITL